MDKKRRSSKKSLKKNQTEVLELENTMNEMKHAIESSDSRLNQTERIGKLKNHWKLSS